VRVSRRGAGVVAVVALLAPLVATVPAIAAPAALAATDAPVMVSVVVPITTRAEDGGLLDAETLATATSPAGVLTRGLDEVLTTSATIALDPMITASIRVLGSGAPDSALAWLDRLTAAPNEVFLLAYSDADVSALARAGALELADDLDLDFAIQPSAFGPAETASPTPTAEPTPTPTGDPDAPPPLPTSDELLSWPETVGRIAWPSEGSAIGADVAAYEAAGYDGLLLSSANLSETASGRVDVDGMPVLVADSAASELFRQASTSIDEATRTQSIERLGVALDGLAAAHPGRSIVLTLDRSSTFGFYGLAETYAALVAREGARLTGLSELLGSPGTAAQVVDGPASDAIQRTRGFVAAIEAEAAFATILDDPALLTAPRRLQLLALLAVSGTTDEDWSTRAAAFLDDSATILGSVSIVDTGDLLVASSAPTIPIHVANGLDFAVTVRLDVRPQRPRIRIESPVEVTIEPGSSKAVRLEAQAITNGDVIVVVSLSSPSTGAQIGQSRSFNVDLQAQWEAVGIVVGAVVVLVFAAGIVRNVVVRRRRAAAERENGAFEDAGAAAGGKAE
jgi:hypothetical protein